jgi:hypothetical protein
MFPYSTTDWCLMPTSGPPATTPEALVPLLALVPTLHPHIVDEGRHSVLLHSRFSAMNEWRGGEVKAHSAIHGGKKRDGRKRRKNRKGKKKKTRERRTCSSYTLPIHACVCVNGAEGTTTRPESRGTGNVSFLFLISTSTSSLLLVIHEVLFIPSYPCACVYSNVRKTCVRITGTTTTNDYYDTHRETETGAGEDTHPGLLLLAPPHRDCTSFSLLVLLSAGTPVGPGGRRLRSYLFFEVWKKMNNYCYSLIDCNHNRST